MKNEKIIRGILILMLLFSVMPTASASIEIVDMGVYYDGETQCGYVDYTNTANHNVSGAILVFIDGNIAVGKIVDMDIRYVAGFRCSPVKTLEIPLRTAKGNHPIVVYVLSQNITAQCSYEYTMEGWEEMVVEGETEFKDEIEDWMKCL